MSKHTPKTEQEMRKEISQIIPTLESIMNWNREMAIEDNRPILNTIADMIYACIEKLNKV